VTIQANQPVTFTGNSGAFSGFKIHDRSGVHLRNLTITRFGNHEARSTNDPNDCIDVRRSTNVVLEHLTISLCGDKQVSMLERSTAFMRLNHFVGDPWHAQFVQVGAQSIGGDDQMLRSTVNWFDGDGYRMPNVNWGKVHSWNNVFDRPFASTQCERRAQCIFEKDVWIAKEPGHTMVKYDPGRGGCNDDQYPCIDEQGAGRVIAPRLENGARAPSFNPDSVFVPTYRYYAEEATEALRDRVRATAGAH
jgi:pectate lyase